MTVSRGDMSSDVFNDVVIVSKASLRTNGFVSWFARDRHFLHDVTLLFFMTVSPSGGSSTVIYNAEKQKNYVFISKVKIWKRGVLRFDCNRIYAAFSRIILLREVVYAQHGVSIEPSAMAYSSQINTYCKKTTFC